MLTPADLAVSAVSWYLSRVGPRDSRTDIDTVSLQRRFPRLADVRVDAAVIPGPHQPIPVRRYHRPDTPATRALVWLHGGAFVAGDLDMPESNWVGLELAARGTDVLAVDYRTAVRGVRHPVPLDEVWAAWIHAGTLWDADATALHLGGASAGGTLAAAATLRVRDGGQALPASLVLAYPMMHPVLPPNTAETLALMKRMPARLRFRPAIVRALARHYAGRAGLTDPYAFPGVASDLHGLPPTFVLTAMIDDLRSSGDTFADQLREAGVTVTSFAESGATHGYLNHPESAAARRSIDRIARWLEHPA